MATVAPAFRTLEIGTRLPEYVRTVSQEDIIRMGLASHDCNPVHMNPEWARRARVFGTESTVAHGMMTMGFLASLVTTWIYPVGGWLRAMESKFTRPVLPGETITARGEVIELHYMGREEDFVVIAVEAVNQKGEPVAVGKARVVIP